MTYPDSSRLGVWIGDRRAGNISRVGDRSRFTLDRDYRADPERPVLGLVFEDHLKNWSLIYRDGRVPSLAPAYDLVSTGHYMGGDRPEDLGLKFGGSREFHKVTLATFRRLSERLGIRDIDLAECAATTVEATVARWPGVAGVLDRSPRLRDAIDISIGMRAKTIMGRVR